MGEFRVSITTPGDDPENPLTLLVDGEDAVDAARSSLGTYRADVLEGSTPSDFLTLGVEPEDPDSPALEVERADGREYWRTFEPDEAAINVVTGQWARWSPEEVHRKGGLAKGWKWMLELSPFEVFVLLEAPRDYRSSPSQDV